jgi:DNA (cytosine-5)-methyltransferase 1
MKIIDLFAGVGGLSYGFSMADFAVVFAVEHDKEIAYTFQQNHKNTDVFSDDIEKLDIKALAKKYQDIDIIVGGPPCQGFSQKGKRLSLNDDRNYLFKYFIDFVKIFQPKYFLLENVPNITTTSDGFFKEEILKAFNDLDYSVDVKILNAIKFGIPQNRKRAFFLGRKGTRILELPTTNNKTTTIKQAIYDLPFINSGEGEEFYEYNTLPSTNYQKLMRKNSNGFYNHQATKHTKLALERLALIPKGKGKEVLPEEHKTKSIFSGTWTRLKEDEFAPTLTTRFDTPSSGMFTHPILNRCLTVREGARIQSFPDKFIFYGNKSSQLKQVGNAVPPLLAFEIAKIILNDTKI